MLIRKIRVPKWFNLKKFNYEITKKFQKHLGFKEKIYFFVFNRFLFFTLKNYFTMKKLFFTFFASLIFLFSHNTQAQEAGAEMRETNKLVEKITLKKMTELNTIKPIQNIEFSKNELPKVAVLPMEMEDNFAQKIEQKIELFKSNKPLTKTQLKIQRKFEKVASSRTGKWIIKKLATAQLKKELRKELRKVKGDKEAEKLLREKYTKKQQKLSGNLRYAAIFGIVGIILTFVNNDVIRVIGIICIIIALVFLLLEVL